MSPKRKVVRRHFPAQAQVLTGGSDAEAAKVARFRRGHQRRVIAVGLFVLAPVLAIAHILEHFDVFRVMSPGLEDVLIGWPTAGLMLVVGGILWG